MITISWNDFEYEYTSCLNKYQDEDEVEIEIPDLDLEGIDCLIKGIEF